MTTVLPFQRPVFGTADFAVLRAALSRFSYPGGWPGWDEDVADDNDCESIDVVDPNDWSPMTLKRSSNGTYQAIDPDGALVGTAPTFDALLAELDILPA